MNNIYKVLFVDDDPNDLHLFTIAADDLPSDKPIELHTCLLTGTMKITEVITSNNWYLMDAVVIDLIMYPRYGTELFDVLRKYGYDSPIILITGADRRYVSETVYDDIEYLLSKGDGFTKNLRDIYDIIEQHKSSAG